MFKIVYSDEARKSLRKLPKIHLKRIFRAIDVLKTEPHAGKKLQGELLEIYSIRAWPYRILYRLFKKEITILILDIGHRQGIYK
ncbi:type II toxin-antitoxin system mRNA interferase toxin, RelE/StbE family [Candidatus Peregrinibacteria bacterium CG11_big_fil_rev_8_21_14_0_20_46_8]|nr:MAG: type II toxin-antitoxin system mRNA interferase toxin, RelE/StbE family [Candidatus Peregrinibacteria bacterium CG11_big_fil_rev_8_21_14_0_20_46_8]